MTLVIDFKYDQIFMDEFDGFIYTIMIICPFSYITWQESIALNVSYSFQMECQEDW
jgi:hypothetical protein